MIAKKKFRKTCAGGHSCGGRYDLTGQLKMKQAEIDEEFR
jgi:hypothetical protein